MRVIAKPIIEPATIIDRATDSVLILSSNLFTDEQAEALDELLKSR